MANASEFRMTNLTPEQAEKFAALFVPTWELPAEIAAGPDPGFKPAAIDAGLVSALAAAPASIPTAPTPEAPIAPAPKPKATMLGIAAPPPPADVVAEAPVIAVAPPAPAAPTPQLPSIMIDEPKPAPAAPKIAPAAPARLVQAEASDAYEAVQKKKSPMLFVGIAAAVAVIGGIAIVALRPSDPAKSEAPANSATVTEKKQIELPEPAVTAAPTETAAKEPEPAKTAAKEAPKEPAPEPAKVAPPPPKEPAKVAEPPKAAAPKAAPPPPPAAPKAAPAAAKKAPKIKDEF